ncbi:MAG: DegT/DnrJ/EryC1/StrS family aminotransferase [Polyangiaceae bacterium]|nr:DegT/DnrJ/EryC1/StrS family aminotransferase [Polyangiaceae bacterium]
MFELGDPELEALGRVVRKGQAFRYYEPSECAAFEQSFAEYLGVPHVLLCSSGTAALVASLIGLGIGPGDEVIVPAVTYMATATSVLSAGAIPVIVDVDTSLTLDPSALERAIGPRTRAVMPVHMWGLSADMGAILRIAKDRNLLVLEDVCQAAGGAYQGKMLGSLGHAGAFSFNHFKNITAGEGGAVSTSDPGVFERMRCAVDCCNYFWNGTTNGFRGFASNSSRASEFEGAILRAQLQRLPNWLKVMREHKARVLAETEDCLRSAPVHSPHDECATNIVFQFETAVAASRFAAKTEGPVVSETGRHLYTRWAPVLEKRGAHHPLLDPFLLPANEGCRKDYTVDMCARSIDIASRSVLCAMNPFRTEKEISELIARLRGAAKS